MSADIRLMGNFALDLEYMGQSLDSSNHLYRQSDTYIPAKTEDVEVDSIVEGLQVIGNSSEDLARQLNLTMAILLKHSDINRFDAYKHDNHILILLAWGYLVSMMAIKLSGTPYNEECRRCVGADEEHHDRDGDQHLHPLLPVLQQRPHPPPRPELRLFSLWLLRAVFGPPSKKSIFPLPSLYLPFCGSRPRSGQEGRGRRLERGPWELQLLGYRQILVGD